MGSTASTRLTPDSSIASPVHGATAPITSKPTDFLSVALAARDRGFTWIVPVDEKAPLRRSWLKYNVTRTETELKLMAAEFSHRDVGIVLRGHAGSVFVWDIDKEGVTERMDPPFASIMTICPSPRRTECPMKQDTSQEKQRTK
ncbi:MAG: hypothetical protein ABR861_15795, partial [Terriglobales bacterium]